MRPAAPSAFVSDCLDLQQFLDLVAYFLTFDSNASRGFAKRLAAI